MSKETEEVWKAVRGGASILNDEEYISPHRIQAQHYEENGSRITRQVGEFWLLKEAELASEAVNAHHTLTTRVVELEATFGREVETFEGIANAQRESLMERNAEIAKIKALVGEMRKVIEAYLNESYAEGWNDIEKTKAIMARDVVAGDVLLKAAEALGKEG